SGIPVYRQLQKENTPFIAGILYTNDMDYQLARLLASQVIVEKPFYEISDESYEEAVQTMRKCKRVINAGIEIGPCNRRLEELVHEAERMGKLFKNF
ncbi:MAG: ABC transporter ATP-binding protein, partial [Lachnospiraceae bacterium]|nr:ABC transporter ATP-binding protein [Lachnospiraceae bacterium]